MRSAGLLSLICLAAACDHSTRFRQGTSHVAQTFGLAVRDTAGAWCAEFPAGADSLAAGTSVTLLIANSPGDTSIDAHIGGRRSSACETAFPQPRWDGYAAFDLTGIASGRTDLPGVVFAVTGQSVWTAAANGRLRGDVDHDGVPEELVRCAADEGEHFTLWSVPPAAPRVRRAHEYFDWGAIVDRTCGPGEDGTETS